MYYVYELVNLLGTVEYVGQTNNPKERFRYHTRVKPRINSRYGKFYKRLDLSMHVVASYPTRAEAKRAEEELQLFWGFPTDRSKHSRKGSRHHKAKLNEEQVREIKTLLSQKITEAEIGRRYGVLHTCISRIKNGKAWSHVTPISES